MLLSSRITSNNKTNFNDIGIVLITPSEIVQWKYVEKDYLLLDCDGFVHRIVAVGHGGIHG